MDGVKILLDNRGRPINHRSIRNNYLVNIIAIILLQCMIASSYFVHAVIWLACWLALTDGGSWYSSSFDPIPIAIDPRTTSWVINAVTRLVAKIGYLPEYVHTQIALHLTAADTELQQVRGCLSVCVCVVNKDRRFRIDNLGCCIVLNRSLILKQFILFRARCQACVCLCVCSDAASFCSSHRTWY